MEIETTVRRDAQVLNRLGLHARPASEFVRCAHRYAHDTVIVIRRGTETYSAGSILEVLTANLDCGARMTLEAAGPRAEEALNELADMLVRFREEEGGADG